MDDDFVSKYLIRWRASEEEIQCYFAAMAFLANTERFDRNVCSGMLHGTAVPRDSREMSIICKNAAQELELILREYPVERVNLIKEIRRTAKDFNLEAYLDSPAYRDPRASPHTTD